MAPVRQRWNNLLLLRPLPQIDAIGYDSVKAALQLTITTVLRRLSADIRQAGVGAILDIGLPVPFLALGQKSSRRELYPTVQKVIASLYKLVCVVAAEEHVNVEDLEGVDVRVILLEDGGVSKGDSTGRSHSFVETIVSLATLASSQRSWKNIFVVEGEEGEAIFRNFSKYYGGSAQISRVPGASSGTNSPTGTVPTTARSTESRRDHFDVILGGTFDHIHIGHKLLLAMFAFLLPDCQEDDTRNRSLTIGITGDELLKEKKYAELLESWDERQDSVLRFLRGIMDFRPPSEAHIETQELSEPGPNGHAIHSWLNKQLVIKCVEISDPFGPTITVEDLTAIVISAETRSGGKAVNDKRKEKGWNELEVFEVDVLDPQEQIKDGEAVEIDFQAKLSSTTIRKGLSERAQARSKV